LRIISLNCNGLRSAARKGFYDWLPRSGADIVCLQETRVQREQIERDPVYFPPDWHMRLCEAERKGYSGVGFYSRRQPDEVLTGLGSEEFDPEGRYIEARFGKLSVVSVYLPSGSSSEDRQSAKYRFLDHFLPLLEEWRHNGRDYVLCGDWNIAHRNIDLKNWRSNLKNSGCLPEERAWMDRVVDGCGWVDAARRLHPEAGETLYTWWSNRGRAWENNVGWRIDYQLLTPGMAERLEATSVYKDERFSDHAPLIVDYRE
jgi:exodeoxyribonuclease-3